MSILGTYHFSVPAMVWGGVFNCLLVSSLYDFSGGFGFKTAASSCPDVMSRPGAGVVLSPTEQF